MKNSKFIHVVILFAYWSAYCQNAKVSTYATETKSIEYSNAKEIFQVCRKNPQISFNEDIDYFWYNEYSKVKSTKGSAGGQLLHGKYQRFDAAGNLINECYYDRGVKTGIEKDWFENGELKATYKYKNGRQIYSKVKSEDGEQWIERVGPMLETQSIKSVYNNFGVLIQSQYFFDASKRKVTDYYFDKKIKQV